MYNILSKQSCKICVKNTWVNLYFVRITQHKKIHLLIRELFVLLNPRKKYTF